MGSEAGDVEGGDDDSGSVDLGNGDVGVGGGDVGSDPVDGEGDGVGVAAAGEFSDDGEVGVGHWPVIIL